MKKTTIKLSKRLAKYSALSLAIGGIADATGQIIYMDVDADVGGTNVNYQLDLNNDATVDFIINNHYDTSSFNDFLEIIPMAGNSVLAFKSSTSSCCYGYFADALNSGAIISEGITSWQNYYYINLNYSSCIDSYSNWCNVTDKYRATFPN